MKVMIVGGGQASLILIDYFQHIDYITLKGVVDLNDSAPGIVRAKELGIGAFKDITALNEMPDVDTIIELTGSDKVRALVLDQLKPHQHFMSSNAAKIMSDFIEVQNRRRSDAIEKVSGEFKNLSAQMKSSEEYIDESIKRIEKVLRATKIVTLNARIEAARAGESGKPFEVVVEAMQGTLDNIQTALRDITTASDESKTTMISLAGTEEKLIASLGIN
ncbi:MAG: methyl-accepting chemotaxis protein [Syntrophobacteraceae bacterium]